MIAYYVLFHNSGDVEGEDEEFTLLFGPCSSFRYMMRVAGIYHVLTLYLQLL